MYMAPRDKGLAGSIEMYSRLFRSDGAERRPPLAVKRP